jgi:hypothetical protein
MSSPLLTRRRISVSLVMLFVAAVVTIVWFGAALQRVREREAMLSDRWVVAIAANDPKAANFQRRTSASPLPVSWHVLGAEPLHLLIRLSGEDDSRELPANWDRVQQLFPEAEIRVQPR